MITQQHIDTLESLLQTLGDNGNEFSDHDVDALSAAITHIKAGTRTADGHYVLPGQIVFTLYGAPRVVCCHNERGAECVAAEPGAIDMDPSLSVGECYVTKDQAAKALTKLQDTIIEKVRHA